MRIFGTPKMLHTRLSNARAVKWIRQSAYITGLEAPSFKSALENILAIHNLFKKHLPPNKLDMWHPDQFQNYHSIATWNRYFTSKQHTSQESVPFHHTVDPKGILASMAQGSYAHTSENEVKFFDRFLGQENVPQYVQCFNFS